MSVVRLPLNGLAQPLSVNELSGIVYRLACNGCMIDIVRQLMVSASRWVFFIVQNIVTPYFNPIFVQAHLVVFHSSPKLHVAVLVALHVV